ncbi:MOSC domain-containing protein [Actinomadura parmotrematis]|uniref:MOSC domain-containing protein n=1 Tax=Actinomadura parmotrematis TaxID=2864039 RepID=A0ABS7FNJ6_9ACTN|nr:MOSC N-terminal beta barrel domain-containing protein [Actinomadura parmotrematis]MBW8481968.1 MOSC domain-containing protein [Actinomadura parmotrematis]
MATLTALHSYPLKSAGGTSLRGAELIATGLRDDREFMLATPEGRHLSQRECAAMARLRPVREPVRDGVLSVRFDDAEPLVHTPVDGGPAARVTVHGNPCLGVDQGDAAAAWFARALGRPCRLVRFTGHRATAHGGGEVAFADGYPLLLISEESLEDLNGRLDAPLPMDRFRPNLVVRGLGAYGEDKVRLLRIGGTEIELVKPCARCVITTTDQETGERGREPLRTLARYRNIDRGLLFGQNAVPRVTGPLAVGDDVEVLAHR